jgi:hypothetical protein
MLGAPGGPPIQSAVNSGGYVAQGWPPPPSNVQPAPAGGSKMPIIFGVVVVAVLLLCGGLFFAVRWFQERREASNLTALDGGVTVVDVSGGSIPTAVATDPNAIPTAPTAALTAQTGPTSALTAPTAALTAPPIDTTNTPAPTATPTPHPTAANTGSNTGTGTAHPTPTPTPTANHPTPTPTPTPVSDGQFDPAAAQAALHRMESILVSCKKPDGPTGAGQVRVTFANDGSAMSSVIVGAPYEGTPVGDCAASRMKLAHMAKFDGPPGIANYTFHILK